MKNLPQRKQTIIGIAVLLIALASILFSGSGLITKPFVDAQMQRFADRIAERAAAKGMNAKFTYGDVAITGLLFGKSAVIAQPRLELSATSSLGTSAVVLSTPRVVMKADSVRANAYRAELPEPLTLERAGEPATVVKYEGAPLAFTVSFDGVGDAQRITHTWHMPPKLLLHERGGDNQERLAATVSYDAAPQVVFATEPAQGAGSTEISFKNITVADASGNETRVGNAKIAHRETLSTPDKVAFDHASQLTDVFLNRDGKALAPFTVRVAADGLRGASSSKDGAARPHSYEAAIKELAVSSDKYILNARGKVSREAGDPLPSGTLEVGVKNFEAFRDSGIVSDGYKPLMVAMVDRITGQPAATSADVSFTIQRPKLGELVVGNAQVSELLTIALSQLVLGNAMMPAVTPATGDPAAPALPEPQQ